MQKNETEAATIHKPRTTKEPIRTCIGCRKKSHPRELLRISRHPEKGVIVVESGAAPGRSAYLCRTAECIEAGLSKSRLSRSLKTPLSPNEIEAIQKELICKLQK